MTVIGKIFVFLVLILSLVQGAMTVFLYSARTQWAAQYAELETKYQVARKNIDQYALEAKKSETDSAAALALINNGSLKKLQDENKALRDERTALQDVEQKRKNELNAAQETVAAVQADIIRRQADVQQLRTTLTAQLDANKKLGDLNNELRQEKTTAEIKANALAAHVPEMESKLQDMARQLALLKTPAATVTSGKPAGAAPNPPQESIEGLVRQADTSGLVKITIGSDAGLVKGHTLSVFRLANTPEQSKYLGTIKIVDVSATEAVGQPMGRMAAPMQVGDRVASRILGS